MNVKAKSPQLCIQVLDCRLDRLEDIGPIKIAEAGTARLWLSIIVRSPHFVDRESFVGVVANAHSGPAESGRLSATR
jgi:hypothetical protein